MKKIETEEALYEEIPPIYNFGSDRDMEVILNRNFIEVDEDITKMIKELYPDGEKVKSK